MKRAGIRNLAVALLLLAACRPAASPGLAAAPAGAGETIEYRLSLDTKFGPILLDGRTAFANDQFAIYTSTWGGLVQMNGRLVGNAMRVTGDYAGNYMSGEGTVTDSRFIVGLDVTGTLLSAVITLSVPPSVAAKLPPT
jgi:hypothetical protein